ncbi:MAG: hypothetical protein ACE5HC_16820 [Candidatus Binatia bacterium]
MNRSKEFVEIKSVFHGKVPLIFTAMAEKQILPIYWPMIKDAIVDDRGIQDHRVKEGLIVALSTKCDNSYCFVVHSYFLHALGFTVKDIEKLVDQLKFPTQVGENEKWSLVLKWSFLFGRPSVGPSGAVVDSNRLIRQLTTNDEYRHLFKICTAIDTLNRFSEFYSNKIRIENEEMFLDSSATLKLPIPDLAKFYKKILQSQSNAEKPVVAICSWCKNIRDAEGKWHSLESVLSGLNRNSIFSHGACPNCYEKFVKEIS